MSLVAKIVNITTQGKRFLTGTEWTDLTGKIRRSLDVNARLEDANGLVPGMVGYVGPTVQALLVDEAGVPVQAATSIITTDYFTLKADITAATANTDVVTVEQAGIKKATLINPHSSIIMYVWFGADPSTGAQYVLYPGMTLSDLSIDNKGDMRYKSSAAGGLLIYDLRG
jgi:hypothetical protein